MKELLFSLCKAQGVSGDENEAINCARKHLSGCRDMRVDSNNNLIVTLGDLKAKRHLLLDAHIDKIGLIVRYIDKDGFIFYEMCGGIDPKVLLGSTVKILGKREILGVIGITPPHLLKCAEKKLPAANEIFIDTGLDPEFVKENVETGDRIVFAGNPKSLLGNVVTSPGLDNRSGVAAIIECVNLLRNVKLNCRLSIVFSANEETTGAGAVTSSYSLKPDEAIAVDVSFAVANGVPESKASPLGSGAIIGVSPVLSSSITKRMTRLAVDNNIRYTFEVMGAATGTNADKISLSRSGVKSGLLSIPLKYMHTPVEVVDLEDVRSVAKLLALYVKQYSEVSQ